MKATTVKKLYKKRFDLYEFDGVWKISFGLPEKNFSAIVYGESGNGKTDFCVQFAKYLSGFATVLYLSNEEGISSTIQEVFMRHRLHESKGKIIMAEKATFDELVLFLKKRCSPKIVLIDSLDYTRLTVEQYKLLRKTFPNKSIIIISWSKGKLPKAQAAKDIEYMVDIKVYVKDFLAHPRSRYGGNEPFVIWEEGAIRKNPALVIASIKNDAENIAQEIEESNELENKEEVSI